MLRRFTNRVKGLYAEEIGYYLSIAAPFIAAIYLVILYR